LFDGLAAHEAPVWIGLASALAILGVNKQLDMQTLFTQVGRELAKSQGWYEQRRVVQRCFIGAVLIGGIASVGLLASCFRSFVRRNSLAFFGVLFLVCFIVIRAASFHHVDELLGSRLLRVSVNNVLELSGIGCVMLAVMLRWIPPEDHPISSPRDH
jgi:hypothetical protein